MSTNALTELRRDPRIDARKPVEFIVDADLIEGSSINVSQSGIRMNTQAPIEVELRFGENATSRAALVWARRNDEGGCEYGFEYIDD